MSNEILDAFPKEFVEKMLGNDEANDVRKFVFGLLVAGIKESAIRQLVEAATALGAPIIRGGEDPVFEAVSRAFTSRLIDEAAKQFSESTDSRFAGGRNADNGNAEAGKNSAEKKEQNESWKKPE